MPILVIRHPDGNEQEEQLVDVLTVGRGDANDVMLSAGGVSRSHARFVAEGEVVRVEDVGSSNGTFVEGEAVKASTPIPPGGVVLIGDYEITVKPDDGQPRPRRPKAPAGSRSTMEGQGKRPGAGAPKRTATAVKRPPALAGKELTGAGGGPSLKGLTGPWMNKVFPLRPGKMLIGRAGTVDIQLDDESLSRRHAELEVGGKGVVVRDLESANGTFVNAEPVTKEVRLRGGDVLQVGVVELSFDLGDPELLRAPTRRSSRAAGRSSNRSRDDSGSAENQKPSSGRKLLRAVVAMLLVGLAVAVVVKVVMPRMKGGSGGSAGMVPGKGPEVDPNTQLQELLSQCRTYSATEGGVEPDFARAEAACNKALDLEPINVEANQLFKKVKLEKACAEHLAKGDKLMTRLREDEALEEYMKITKECSSYYKVKPKVTEAIEGVKKKAADDCRRYVKIQQWESALPRCEIYMKLACPKMSNEQLYPPPGFTLVTSEFARLRPKQWRPKHPMYLNFLNAREKVQPGSPIWRCPQSEMLVAEDKPQELGGDVKRALAKRFTEKMLLEALYLYWLGKQVDAINLLQRLREKPDKAPFHATADELRRDMSAADSLFKEGQSELQSEDPLEAAAPFNEALDLDRKLMAELTETAPSYLRRTILQDMAARSYEKGKSYADKEDFRRACKIWKLGFSFYKGNGDINKAVSNVCSQNAITELGNVQECEGFARVEDFAVDGDGVAERVKARKAEMKCP
jgi:pSer/pThr/pTyr-binding forkhead associated (FHA) protein